MSEWISVKDKRKPPLQEDEESFSVSVLLYVPIWNCRDKQPIVWGNYLHKSKVFRPTGSMGFEEYVTHWMPLPEPPKEQS